MAKSYGSEDIKLSGYIAAEVRIFTQDAKYSGQTDDINYSTLWQPEFRLNSGSNQFTFIPFLRKDSVDEERTHTDIRELYWRNSNSDWESLIGVNRVFWGVMESRHLVDIINQTDLVEDIDGEEKLGQPMLQFSYFQDWGTLDLFLLTGFRERTFPGESGRLRTALPVDSGQVIYESSREESHVDTSIRYSHTKDNWDIGGYYFYGTSREPRFQLNIAQDRLVPVYDIINQLGVDAQYTANAWLWKVESLYREGQGNGFLAVSAGFEYTLYQFAGSQKDLGLLTEYHYDGRDETAAPTIYDHDIFIGARLAFNNVEDTSVLAGMTIDNSGNDRFYNIEAEHRFGENIKAELKIRLFTHGQPGSLISQIEQDDYIQLQLRYYH